MSAAAIEARDVGTTAGAAPAVPPAPTERLVPREGEALWVVRQEHLELILSGAKTLVLRPWRTRRRRRRWFLATRGAVCGKVTVGEPFQVANAAAWAAHAGEHLEGPTMQYRESHCWAYPLSRPLRLRPLSFRWEPDAVMWCRYRRSEASAPSGPPNAPRAERHQESIQTPRLDGRSVEVVLPRRYGRQIALLDQLVARMQTPSVTSPRCRRARTLAEEAARLSGA